MRVIFLTKVLISKGKNNEFYLKNRRYIILIVSVFIIGMIFGSFSINVCNNSDYYGLSNYFDSFILFLKSSSFLNIYCSFVFTFLLLLLINFILGLCLVGNVFIVIILLLYSFAIGSISAFLYCKYSLIGISYFVVSILPCLFLMTINYLICVKHSFVFSKDLCLLSKNSINSIDFKSYIVKYFIHFIFVILFSIMFSLFSKFLINLF